MKAKATSIETTATGSRNGKRSSTSTSFAPSGVAKKMTEYAKQIVKEVKENKATTSYKNRPIKGIGAQVVKIGSQYDIDCSGFIRLLYRLTCDADIPAWALSDRPFARAKDFLNFFEALPSIEEDCDHNNNNGKERKRPANAASASNTALSSSSPSSSSPPVAQSKNMVRWRRVPSIKQVLPGDVIAYTTTGHAAGGSCFIKSKALSFSIRQAIVADLWNEAKAEGGYDSVDQLEKQLHDADSRTAALVEDLAKLCGIDSLAKLQQILKEGGGGERGAMIDEMLSSKGKKGLGKRFWSHVLEAATAKLHHTGHVVLASSCAFRLGHDDNGRQSYSVTTYEATTVRSATKNKRCSGVMEWYRQFRVESAKKGHSISGKRRKSKAKQPRTRQRWVNVATAKRIQTEKLRGRCNLSIGRLLGEFDDAGKITSMEDAKPPASWSASSSRSSGGKGKQKACLPKDTVGKGESKE